MLRKLNREVLDRWLEANSPDGISKLALKSHVSSETIKRFRSQGLAPKKFITCKLIADALGIEIDTLFPTKNKAS
jgi:DNA-binding phage protein